MHSTFDLVIWVACVLAVVIALGLLVVSGKTWEDFGRGRFALDRDSSGEVDSAGSGRPASGVAIAERDAEIRQLIEALAARRARRGEAPSDVEQEFARLTAPAGPSIDLELREEIRQLVVARNHRRVRAGRPHWTWRQRSIAAPTGRGGRDRSRDRRPRRALTRELSSPAV